LAINLFIGQAYAINLDQVIGNTLNNNPDIKIVTSVRHAVKYELKQAEAAYYPSIDITLGYGQENSDNVTTNNRTGGDLSLDRQEAALSIKQMLFDGFDTQAATARQAARLNAADYRLQEMAETVTLRVIEAYFSVLMQTELLELTKDNLVVHQKTLKDIKALSEQGAGRHSDYQQTAGREALATSSMLYATGNLSDSQANYLRVTSEMPENLETKVQHTFNLPESLEAALKIAHETHTSIQAAKAELIVAKSAAKQSKSSYYPDVHFEIDATRNENLDGVEFENNDVSAMLRLRYNLYRGGADKARVAAALQRTQAAQATVQRHEQVVEEGVRLTWNALDIVKQRIEYLEKHVSSSKIVVKSYSDQFRIGRRSLLDVLDSKNELYTAKASLINGRYAAILNYYRLLASTGQLLSSFNLNVLPDDTKE
jgi:adhesin transport system outer membrane protein